MNKSLISRSSIPNSFTALNALSGFVSIVLAGEGELLLAAIFIIGAAFFDLLDGILARLLKTSSEFGVQLDSLSDVVSFGAAPSYLIYKAFLFEYGYLGILISSSILLFGAFRLARFNTQVDDLESKKDFKGMPIPIAGMTIATLIIGFLKNGELVDAIKPIVIPLVLLLSILMVSSIRYNSFPKLSGSSIKGRLLALFLLIAGIVLVFVTAGIALFFIFVTLVLHGIVRHFYCLIFLSKENNSIQINENK